MIYPGPNFDFWVVCTSTCQVSLFNNQLIKSGMFGFLIISNIDCLDSLKKQGLDVNTHRKRIRNKGVQGLMGTATKPEVMLRQPQTHISGLYGNHIVIENQKLSVPQDPVLVLGHHHVTPSIGEVHGALLWCHYYSSAIGVVCSRKPSLITF